MTTDVYYDLFKNVEQHTQELISDTEAGVLLYKTADEWRNTLYDIASIGYRKGSECFARRIIKNNVPYDLLVGMVTGLSPSEVDKVKESIAQEEQGNALFESYEADDFYVSDASQLLNGSISASDFSAVTGVSRDEAERICNKFSEKCNDNESPVNALAYLKAAVRSYQITYRRFARMLLSCSMSIEDVRKLTSLPQDEIERIKSELFLSEKEN